MEVSKDVMEPMLMSHASKAAASDSSEWVFEFKIDLRSENHENKWSQATFQRVLQALRSDSSYTESILPDVLTVSSDDNYVSLHISDVPNISLYCLNENPKTNGSKWTRKSIVASELLPDELPIHIQSHVYETHTMDDYDPVSWNTSMKYYSLSKTFMYAKDDHVFKIIMKRESDDMYTNMKSSGVSGKSLHYEFHMESKVRTSTKVGSVLEACAIMIQLLTQQRALLSKAQQLSIVREYDALVKKVLEVPKWQQGKFPSQDKFHFLAPKPITLERMHLVEPGPESYGVQSILKGYAVTDKADGERMLLYINKTGDGYLINNVFEVYGTGLKTHNKDVYETLLDGEFITSPKKDIFAVFDIYFMSGKSLMQLPLIKGTSRHSSKQALETVGNALKSTSRYGAMNYVCREGGWQPRTSHIDLRCKEHIPADGRDMFDACKSLLDSARNLPYDIDGLIFTPRELSVFGYYPGIPVPIPENVKWEKVLKWKPPEQNTIDFYVEAEAIDTHEVRVDPITRKKYKRFNLYTGYNAAQWEPITPMEGVTLRYDYKYANSKKTMRNQYRAKLFKPFSYYSKGVEVAELEVNDSGDCVCSDGSIVDKNKIVEFAFNETQTGVTATVSRQWIPLRVRDDKTRVLHKAIVDKSFPPNFPSKTANDLNVAMSIWRSLHNPVNRTHITGMTPTQESALPDSLEERLLGVDDVYYARDVPRQHLLSVNMLDFHNQGIKKALYERSKNRDSLIEFACGMAGDLPRWRDGGYRFVMGVDLSRDNITNPRDGAYARLLKQRHVINQASGSDGIERARYLDAVFVVGDCAQPLHNPADASTDEESVKLLKILYNKPGGGAVPSYVTKYLGGRAAKGFGMASCMFAIHYFFKTEATLDGFLSNVAMNLRKGGIFITTFMDGEHVHALLNANPEVKKAGFIEGRKLEGSVPVWAIISRYTSFSKEDCWGKHVDVFLENTNKLIPEFVVHFDRLVEKARSHGLELEEDGMFSDTFNKIRSNANMERPSRLEQAVLALENDPVQTQFSFLNRWAVFVKNQ